MSAWFLIVAAVLELAGVTLVYLDLFVWIEKSPHHLGEMLQVIAVVGLVFLVLSILLKVL